MILIFIILVIGLTVKKIQYNRDMKQQKQEIDKAKENEAVRNI